jgi:hypothetical protein
MCVQKLENQKSIMDKDPKKASDPQGEEPSCSIMARSDHEKLHFFSSYFF